MQYWDHAVQKPGVTGAGLSHAKLGGIIAGAFAAAILALGEPHFSTSIPAHLIWYLQCRNRCLGDPSHVPFLPTLFLSAMPQHMPFKGPFRM